MYNNYWKPKEQESCRGENNVASESLKSGGDNVMHMGTKNIQ